MQKKLYTQSKPDQMDWTTPKLRKNETHGHLLASQEHYKLQGPNPVLNPSQTKWTEQPQNSGRMKPMVICLQVKNTINYRVPIQ